MNKLYCCYIWFSTETSILENHDVVFLNGSWDFEKTKKTLIESTDTPENFHIDLLLDVLVIDGFQVSLSTEEKIWETNKLFFGYMWAESKDYFSEDHELLFVVAEDKDQAKIKMKAKTKLEIDIHVDFLKELDVVDWLYVHINSIGWEDSDSIDKLAWYTQL